MYRDVINAMIDKFGSECLIERTPSNVVYFKALIQPLRQKYDSYATSFETDGRYDDRMYLYIGKVVPDLTRCERGTMITNPSGIYMLDTAELYYVGAEPVYCRAYLRRRWV